MVRIATLVVCLTLVVRTSAYPSGAQSNITNPMDAFSSHCTSGNYRPNHGNNLPQASPAPYTITVSSPGGTTYRTGDVVTVTIEGKKNSSSPNFKGFFIQGDSTEASFAGDVVCDGVGKKVSFCGRSGATHVNSQVKDKVVCTWTPPDYQIGRVQFVASIVSNFTTFWTGVKSSTTLLADPTMMTYQEKSNQLREQMMRQFQQGSPGGFGNLMGQQPGANPFSQLFG